MNSTTSTPFFAPTAAQGIVLLLANVLLAEDGAAPTRDISYALSLLQQVFEGRKIVLIKFIRENTGWGLKDSKEFMEDYIQVPPSTLPESMIRRMQYRRNIVTL